MDRTADVVPDQLLLWGMSHGSPEAAGELRRRHGKSLYALAYGVLWDSVEADAVVSQAFDQAARTGREFRAGAGSVFRWLTSITRLRAETVAATVTALPRHATPRSTLGLR